MIQCAPFRSYEQIRASRAAAMEMGTQRPLWQWASPPRRTCQSFDRHIYCRQELQRSATSCAAKSYAVIYGFQISFGRSSLWLREALNGVVLGDRNLLSFSNAFFGSFLGTNSAQGRYDTVKNCMPWKQRRTNQPKWWSIRRVFTAVLFGVSVLIGAVTKLLEFIMAPFFGNCPVNPEMTISDTIVRWVRPAKIPTAGCFPTSKSTSSQSRMARRRAE
jgi:hypothetical protein